MVLSSKKMVNGRQSTLVGKKLMMFSVMNLLTISYSYYFSRKFYSCGNKIRIHFPVIINNPQKIEVADNVRIAQHCWLNCIDTSKNHVTLKIGKNCSIGRFAHINAYEEVFIEDYVMISERVHISDVSHRYSDFEVPIILQGTELKGKIRIKKGAWIGIGAVIMPGVTIGKNAVIGANAVVTKDVPDNYIARGVPAQIFPKKNIKLSVRDL